MDFVAEVGGERLAAGHHRVGEGLKRRVGKLDFGGRLRDEDAFGYGQRGGDESAEAEDAAALQHLAAREHLSESAEAFLVATLAHNRPKQSERRYAGRPSAPLRAWPPLPRSSVLRRRA